MTTAGRCRSVRGAAGSWGSDMAPGMKGLVVQSVAPGSPAGLMGLRAGDRVVSVGGRPARDTIDFLYHAGEDGVELAVKRGMEEFQVALAGSGDFGIEFEPLTPLTCGNRCIFCFIDQNPPGMRQSLYVKDEDYRFSFLFGSYVTLTAIGERDLKRIISQRLSPLYVSVHATDEAVREKLLGLEKPDRLMEKLEQLTGKGIRIHAQMVVCPGINDGAVLERSIADLRALSPNLLSVAVVPVGLTRYRGGLFPLMPVDGEHARRTIGLVDGIHRRYAGEGGDGFVYCADEWYLRTGTDIPAAEYYGDFPQIENGVGMVRRFLDAAAGLEARLTGKRYRKGQFVLVTGVSMAPFIEDVARRLSALEGLSVRAVRVTNGFYGETVTVSGLLVGGDIRRTLGDIEADETVVLPPNCLNDDGFFLDDLTLDDLARDIGARVIQGGYDPVELFL
ncbi:DUF512 domain-containing protein [Candidatus Latescibacterota bacterium]